MAQDPPAAQLGRRSVALRVGGIALVAAVILALVLSGAAPSSDRLREWGDELPAAPFVWPLIFAAINFLVLWPVLAGVTGALFGTAVGTPVAIAGVLLASTLQFSLARHGAGEHLRERVHARLPGIGARLERHGFLTVFYSRIVPAVPWGPVNYAAGLGRVKLRDVLLGTLAGGSPKVFAYVALGGSFDDLSRPEAIVALALLVLLGIIGALVARRQLRAR